MIIKSATSSDLTKIARCHIAAFPDSVTSLFGVTFVSQMLEWYLSAPNKFLFWIEEENRCIGYCGGLIMDGSDAVGSASGMTQFGFHAASKFILRKPWLLFHPEIRARYPFILTNVNRKIKKVLGIHPMPAPQPTQAKTAIPLTAGLVVIGVIPDLHKKGIGSLLQTAFEKIARERGARLMQLSVRKENTKAISSYQRNGWHIDKDEHISYTMIKPLS